MLIKIEDLWVNPEEIQAVYYEDFSKYVVLSGRPFSIGFTNDGNTADDIANKVNRYIKRIKGKEGKADERNRNPSA